jgi:hypothetical protein
MCVRPICLLDFNLSLSSCNWLGAHASFLAMDCYGHNRLVETPFTIMTINGKAVVEMQNVDNFPFA